MGWTGRTGWDGTVIKMKRVFPVATSGHLKSVWNVILDINPIVRLKNCSHKLTSKKTCNGVYKVNKNRMQSLVNCLKLFTYL